MVITCESEDLKNYLEETEEIDFSHLVIREKGAQLADLATTEIQLVKTIFEFVRDEIAHSWDIQSRRVTRKASEVLVYKEGICYAKSNLLAALLRSLGIPAGFCYQRLTIGDQPETGYGIHAFNAVYLSSLQRWVRLDGRGNKEGVHAEFSTAEERLAFPVRDHLDEHDYPTIYVKPNHKTMETLKKSTDCLKMYLNHLPAEI